MTSTTPGEPSQMGDDWPGQRTEDLTSDTGVYVPFRPHRYMSPIAGRVQELSVERWGENRPVTIVGQSKAIVDLLKRVEKAAKFEEPVLITGESGAGKESLAQAIHLLSPRQPREFVAVNCPQYEGELASSELFGHVKGAFTGATADRAGAFETASSGSIFFDEVGDLPIGTQVKLLRCLASSEYAPVGSNETRHADVRVVAATNKDLRNDDEFRDDLFFRLSMFRISLPPLRDREDDWALLAEYFLRRLQSRYGEGKRLSAKSTRFLASYDWPGNVRELYGVITTGYAMSSGKFIDPEDFEDALDRKIDASAGNVDLLWTQITEQGTDFWSTAYESYMDRELNRSQLKRLIRRGLKEAGSYRKLVAAFNLPEDDYQKFMDFLRHHRVRP